MDSVRYVLALLVWATFPPAFLYWFLIHPFIGYWRRVGGPLQTYLIVGPICILAMGILLRWNPLQGGDLGMNWPVFGVGFGLWVVSWAMERKIRVHLDFRTLAGVPELKWGATEVPRLPTMEEFIADEDESDGDVATTPSRTDMPAAGSSAASEEGSGLLQEGIYAWVRHPRYLAVMIGMAGWSMMANYSVTYLLALLTGPILLGIIHFEEKELLERFGAEYRAYQERVPALFPRRSAN